MKDPREMSASALAYLGDAVLELYVREYLVTRGITSSKELNDAALAFVRAHAQSEALEHILPHLSERETEIYKNGRNNNKVSVPKSASALDYRRATGFETLFGYLHLAGEKSRMDELFALAYEDVIKNFNT